MLISLAVTVICQSQAYYNIGAEGKHPSSLTEQNFSLISLVFAFVLCFLNFFLGGRGVVSLAKQRS